jgi:L-seryl-tRNA(Ser) seleniumtransferase
MSEFRKIPSVDQLLQTSTAGNLIATYGRSLTLNAIRSTLEDIRTTYQAENTIPDPTLILEMARKRMEIWVNPTLISTINATGVILHTNLGRAPLSWEAIKAVQQVSFGYCTLEYNLKSGIRSERLLHTEGLFKKLLGVEAAMVVNNNASAVMLVLAALAKKRRVIVARSQLVEIGGSFRIPDILKQSGARLVEVGTTNRVHLSDFEDAIQQPAVMIFKAHHSNFKIIGFTSEPSLAELANLGKKYGVLIVDDLGSGAILDTARFGLSHEPMVQESIAGGADLVCFSGDKLLGGPQAGIIVGKVDLISKLKKHPLARVLRADKLCLAALTVTLLHYLKDEAEGKIPIWQMISKTPEQIHARAQHWADTLHQGVVLSSRSTIGGGSLPEETQPTFVLALKVPQPNRFLKTLRGLNPPIIARLEAEQVCFDPRTVLPEQEGAFLVGLQNAIGKIN